MAFPSLIDYKRYIEENKPNGKPVPNRSDSPSEKPVLYHDTAGYVKKHVQNASAMMRQIQDNMPLSKISASILNSVSHRTFEVRTLDFSIFPRTRKACSV